MQKKTVKRSAAVYRYPRRPEVGLNNTLIRTWVKFKYPPECGQPVFFYLRSEFRFMHKFC